MKNQQKPTNLFGSGNEPKLEHIIPTINFLNQKCQFQSNQHLPVQVQKKSLQGKILKQKSFIVTSFQIQSKLFYAFAEKQNQDLDVYSNITFYQFRKENGQHKIVKLNKIKGQVSAIKIDLLHNFNQTLPNQKQKQSKVKKTSIYTFAIILGTKAGYIKKINLQTQKVQSKILDNKPVLDILPHKSISKKNNFYFVLMQSTQIFLVNIHNLDVLIKYRPNILKEIDSALSLKLDWSESCLMETTKSGYIILWQINKKSYNQLCEKSEAKQFKANEIIADVFPKFITHNFIKDGLLFIDFFGNLLFLITVQYKLKIISIDLKMKESFVTLLQFSLPSAPKQIPYIFQNHCFKLDQQNFCFYYSIQAEKHSIYKLQLNDFMQIQSVIKYKIKELKNVDQFCISNSGSYILARQDEYFFIKYLPKSQQTEIDRIQFQY